jgi:hypothetical protein
MKARVSNLCKRASEWENINFTPLAGELVIYEPDDATGYVQIKIGDGKRSLQDLPFVIEAIATDLIAKAQHAKVCDAKSITTYF